VINSADDCSLLISSR